MNFKLSILLLIIISLSCTNNRSRNDSIDFFKESSIRRVSNIPSAFPQMLQSLFYLTDTTTLFSVYDMATVSIRVFDLNKDQLKLTIPCEKAVEKTEYPNRIGGYYIQQRFYFYSELFFKRN